MEKVGFNSANSYIQEATSPSVSSKSDKLKGLEGFDAKLKGGLDKDEISFGKDRKDLSLKDRQKIMKKARKRAAGASMFTLELSTLYYALRSDETVAKKYKLDAKRDRSFIKEIKKQQVMQTIPSWFGLGPVAWIYNSFKSKKSQKV